MIHKVLDLLNSDREKHALFLNSLSVLEYAGARKIMKSQKAENLNLELLAHISEEIRHTRLLKNLALNLSQSKLTTYGPKHLLNGSAAWDYIQSVDLAVAQDLGEQDSSWLNYLYTTLLIEERAMEVYPPYEIILKGFGFSNPLAGLIAEEEHHLEFTRRAVESEDRDSEARFKRLKIVENEAFTRFMEGVCATLQSSKSDEKGLKAETFSLEETSNLP